MILNIINNAIYCASLSLFKVAKNMQFSKSVMRINYLKNIYYTRISSYMSVFLFSNLIGV